MTEVTFERKIEKLGVTRCSKERVKEGCKEEYVEAPYTLPTLAENINEFLDMNIPEPEKACHTFRYEIPEITCKDVTTTECSEVAHVDPITVTKYLDTVQLDYKGKCGQRVLEHQQQICTKEDRITQPIHAYKG